MHCRRDVLVASLSAHDPLRTSRAQSPATGCTTAIMPADWYPRNRYPPILSRLAATETQSDQTMQQATIRKYYFVSDLHMGGDGQLQHCDYIAEFVAFL